MATDKTAFRLSRIYAQGWNAARKPRTDAKRAMAPYPADPERATWQRGFSEGAGLTSKA